MKLEQRTSKIIQTPAEALQTLLDKYQITAKILSRHLRISCVTIFDILKGELRINTRTAIYLSKYFRTTPKYWLNLQMIYDINKLNADPNFLLFVEAIPRAKKPKSKEQRKISKKQGLKI